MRNRFAKFSICLGLVLWIIIIISGNVFAGSEKGFDAKKRAFCRTMLNHGQDAYSRGDYEKAGYYLQQAVQADPAHMAKSWFNQGGMESDAASAPEEIAPQAPATTAQPEKPAEKVELIMGDDEGC